MHRRGAHRCRLAPKLLVAAVPPHLLKSAAHPGCRSRTRRKRRRPTPPDRPKLSRSSARARPSRSACITRCATKVGGRTRARSAQGPTSHQKQSCGGVVSERPPPSLASGAACPQQPPTEKGHRREAVPFLILRPAASGPEFSPGRSEIVCQIG